MGREGVGTRAEKEFHCEGADRQVRRSATEQREQSRARIDRSAHARGYLRGPISRTSSPSLTVLPARTTLNFSPFRIDPRFTRQPAIAAPCAPLAAAPRLTGVSKV